MLRNKTVAEFDQLNRPKDTLPNQENVIKCPKCGCSWMEEVAAKQFDKNTTMIIGQKPATAHTITIYLMRCLKCAELIEGNVFYSGPDNLRKAYDFFLDTVEAKPQE